MLISNKLPYNAATLYQCFFHAKFLSHGERNIAWGMGFTIVSYMKVVARYDG
jgi:hypothetical protein